MHNALTDADGPQDVTGTGGEPPSGPDLAPSGSMAYSLAPDGSLLPGSATAGNANGIPGKHNSQVYTQCTDARQPLKIRDLQQVKLVVCLQHLLRLLSC